MRSKSVVMTSMIMMHDLTNDLVVVQERTKNWCGITFPGGHIEPGESMVACAKREAEEETGLVVEKLALCGIVHWYKLDSDERYMVFLYRTHCWSGTLLQETKEGRVYWESLGALSHMRLSNNMDQMLKVFLQDDKSEAFGVWVEDFTAPLEIL